jgi:CheY-like chemotaxis protein
MQASELRLNPIERGSPKKVLIAEDDPEDRMLLERIGKRLGSSIQFYFVRDGEELMKYLEGSEQFGDRATFPLPDLILLDMHMPILSGVEALQWIRGQERFAHLRVFAWSGSESSAEFEMMRAAGADKVMPRPREYEDLKALVQNFADGLWKQSG